MPSSVPINANDAVDLYFGDRCTKPTSSLVELFAKLPPRFSKIVAMAIREPDGLLRRLEKGLGPLLSSWGCERERTTGI